MAEHLVERGRGVCAPDLVWYRGTRTRLGFGWKILLQREGAAEGWHAGTAACFCFKER